MAIIRTTELYQNAYVWIFYSLFFFELFGTQFSIRFFFFLFSIFRFIVFVSCSCGIRCDFLVEKRWAAWPIYIAVFMLGISAKSYCWRWVSADVSLKRMKRPNMNPHRIVMWTMAMGSFTPSVEVGGAGAESTGCFFHFFFSQKAVVICHFRLFTFQHERMWLFDGGVRSSGHTRFKLLGDALNCNRVCCSLGHYVESHDHCAISQHSGNEKE